MLPKQALHSSVYAASSPEENNIIDPYAMSNTPSHTGTYLQPLVYPAAEVQCCCECKRVSELLDSASYFSMTAMSLSTALIWGWGLAGQGMHHICVRHLH